MDVAHRKKANKQRNGRSRYEKGRSHHQNYPAKKLVRGRRGSTTHNVEPSIPKLADVWPKDGD